MAERDSKLQVFVSSTYLDMKSERQAAVEAILKAGHIPAGMELFAAQDRSQLEVIYEWINDSDAFLLILGGRYGTIEESTGKSYIQLEYEYAVTKKKPFFAVVMSDEWLQSQVLKHGEAVRESAQPLKYAEFRKLVESKLRTVANSCDQVKLAIHESIPTLIRKHNLVGWIHASTAPSPQLANELARLSAVNVDLRNKLSGGFDPKVDQTISQLKSVSLFKIGNTPSEKTLSDLLCAIVQSGNFRTDMDATADLIHNFDKTRSIEVINTAGSRAIEHSYTLQGIGVCEVEQSSGHRYLIVTPHGKTVYQRLYQLQNFKTA